jgi:hypothetical protein
LALDELTDTGVNLRPALAPEMEGETTIRGAAAASSSADTRCAEVVDDPGLFARLETETNLPRFLVPALKSMY